MDIFDLSAKLSLDSADYEEKLSKAEKSTGSFASKLKSGLATAGKVGAAAIGAVTTAAGVMTKTILDGTKEVAAYGDNIDKASQKMGISAEAYQEWDAVLQHSDTSIDVLQRGMMTMSKAVESGNKSFKKLGITEKQLAKMSQEEIFEKVIEGLQSMEEGTERTALASELLGGAAKELGPLLNTSADDTKKMRERVKELGGVMSNDAVKAAAAYQDSLQDMQTALDGAKRGITTEFLPAVTSVMDGLTEVFSGNGEGGLAKISEGIGQFVDKLSESMPRVLEFGSQIILSLSSAITENLPTLISAATQTILTLANGFLEQLPQILEVGLQILVSLAQGIAENLPTLIPTIVDVILKIVDILTDPANLTVLLEASIAIILALANGLIDALPRLLEKAPEIVENLVTSIIDNASKLWDAAKELIDKLAEGIEKVWNIIKEKGPELIDKLWEGIKSTWRDVLGWGKEVIKKVSEGFDDVWDSIVSIGMNIVNGVWKGISDAADWLWRKVKGFFSGIVDGVLDFLGIASPSKVFARIGKFTAEGFGVGFDKEFDSVADDVADKMASLADNSVDLATNLTSDATDPLLGGLVTETEAPALMQSLNDMNSTLSQILDSMGFNVVLNDGVIAGRVDKLLGQTAMRKVRGNA